MSGMLGRVQQLSLTELTLMAEFTTVPSRSTPSVSYGRGFLLVFISLRLRDWDACFLHRWRRIRRGGGFAHFDGTFVLRIYEWVCEGDESREKGREKMDVLHGDGKRCSDFGLGTSRVVVIMKSYLESGSRVTLCIVGNVLAVLFSCRCPVTHAVKQMLKPGCWVLPRVGGADTPHIPGLIGK